MKRVYIHSLAFCILVAVFYVTAHEVFAQNNPPPATLSNPVASRGWISSIVAFITDPAFAIVQWLALGWLSIFSWLTGIAGMLLNFSIDTLVIGMGSMVRTLGFGASIDTLWRLIRDLVNITFVFSLIYIGIATIIGIHGHNVKSALRSVIIAALLVNFSLFFAKAVIDVSNIVADSIYRKMMTRAETRGINFGISSAFMDRMGVTPLQIGGSDSRQKAVLESVLKDPKAGGIAFLMVYTIGASVLLFALAISFAFGAFLLIVRFVILILLMITSPIAFLPKEIPFLGGYSKQWWDTLLNQAFLAPIYLFGLYLALLVIEGTPFGKSPDGLSGIFVAEKIAESFPTLLFYLIGLVLIIGATSMAKKMSNAGAASMIHAGSWAGKMLGGSLAVGGYAGRKLGGRLASSKYAQKGLAAMRTGQTSRFAAVRGLSGIGAKTITSAQSGSWDLRGTASFGKMAGMLGVDAGKAPKTSYEKWLKDKKEDEAEHARSLNNKDTEEVKKAKAGVEELEHELHDHTTTDENGVETTHVGLETQLKEAKKINDEAKIKKLKNKIEGIREEIGDKKKDIVDLETINQKKYADVVKKGWLQKLLYTAGEREGIAKAIKEDIDKNKKSAKKGEEYKPKAREKKADGGGKAEEKHDDHGKGDDHGGAGGHDDHGGGHGGGH